jgi:hypothetical protein
MKTVIIAVLFCIGCSTNATIITTKPIIEDVFRAEPFYVNSDDYKKYGIKFLGDDLVIMELINPVEYISTLRGKVAVSFTATTMPKDLEMHLKRYRMTTGESFYNYVISNTDRFIFCPEHEILIQGHVAGSAYTKSRSSWLYPGENITFINMCGNWDKSILQNWLIADVMIHEAAHHELRKLIHENTVSKDYDNFYFNERHSRIIELEFLYSLKQDFVFSSNFRWELDNTIYGLEKEVDRYNSHFELQPGDRILFPK